MTVLRIPGLVDPHVHLREPGATHKEDLSSGTAAALAGGFTCVLDMPNTTPPTVDAASVAAKRARASQQVRCDYGLYLGATTANIESAASLAPQVAGLKMYLDQTFGTLRMDSLAALIAHAERWPATSPLLCHAEGRTAAAAILAAHLAGRAIHICHVSRQEELDCIRKAKERGIAVTCEATPHHLFLSTEQIAALGAGRAEVRPRLATAADRAALRANLAVIDCFATDHAPHTLAEKDSADPPPGFPGLETALPLYLALVHEGLLTLEELLDKTLYAPRRIFGLPEQPDTWVDIDPDEPWTIRGAAQQTRAGWTPFERWTVRGRIQRVVLRGQEVVRDGQVLAEPGSGHLLLPQPHPQSPNHLIT
jgi:carbamoyl-phosphate synthase/aspartate carbamoyltransferase/dihydroorotase